MVGGATSLGPGVVASLEFAVTLELDSLLLLRLTFVPNIPALKLDVLQVVFDDALPPGVLLLIFILLIASLLLIVLLLILLFVGENFAL